MLQLKTTGLQIGGLQEMELTNQLEEYFDNSPAAEKHLKAAGAKGVEINYSADIGATSAEGRKVLLYQRTHTNAGIHTLSLKEVAESALFEIQNALNADRQPKGSLTVLLFGKEMADLEAESTWKVAEILSELTNYVPSDWGAKQIDAVKGRSLSVLKPIFASLPHDRAQPGKFSLISKYFYAYDHAFEASAGRLPKCSVMGMRGYLAKIATITHLLTRKTYQSPKCMNAWQTFGTWGLSNEQFFVSLMMAVRDIEKEPNWAVTWHDAGPGQGNWVSFAEAITAAIGPVILNRKVGDIKTTLQGAILAAT